MHRDDEIHPLPVDPDLDPDDPAEPGPTHVRTIRPTRRSREHRTLVAVAAGGYLGTLGRYLATQTWPTPSGGFPATTFAINTSGAFLIAVILATLLTRHPTNRWLRPFLCTGVIGGWTTMSALAVDLVLLSEEGHATVAVTYAVATLVAGVFAAWLGVAIARRVTRPVSC
jgi:fluoride exporter